MSGKESIPLFYRTVRFFLKLGVDIFFNKVEMSHAENIPKGAPVILASNHPNSVMDALVLVAKIDRKINYIAHSGLFKNKLVSWFLYNCGVIPVYRSMDHPEEMEQNIQTFRACYQVLESGGVIGIFPEGISDATRQVKKLKTGVARIALEAEAKNNFSLGVKIIPVGLNFSTPRCFRSDVLINFGKPIELASYFDLYEKNAYEGVKKLTDDLQVRLEQITVSIRELSLAQLVRDIETLYRDELKTVDAQEHGALKAIKEELFISRRIVDCVQYYVKHDPQRVAEIRDWMERYKRKLKRLHLRDQMLRKDLKTISMWRNSLRFALIGLLGFPLTVYGVINNFLPYKITGFCARRFTHDRTNILFTLFFGGGLAFGFFYLLQMLLVGRYLGAGWAILYAISLPLSGFFALAYLRRIETYRLNIRYAFFLFTNKHLMVKIRRERKRLIQRLNEIKDKYLAIIDSQRSSGQNQ